jgi:hypothetical protein
MKRVLTLTGAFVLCMFFIFHTQRSLLNAGHDTGPNAALISAIDQGDLPAVKRLIAAGANPNAWGKEPTPPGYKPIDDDSIKYDEQWSALMHAARPGDPAIVTYLLDRGADVGACTRVGNTALLLAFHFKGSDDLDAIALKLIDRGADVSQCNTYGFSPLWAAAASGRPLVVKQLLARGVNPNQAVPHAGNPYDAAQRMGHKDCLVLLKRAGGVPSK